MKKMQRIHELDKILIGILDISQLYLLKVEFIENYFHLLPNSSPHSQSKPYFSPPNS